VTKLITGIFIVAAVATAGDYVWYEFGVRSRMIAGILHGALLLMAVGGALGWPARRVVVGLQMGAVAGVIGALTYYASQASLGQSAMIVAWATVWIVLGLGEGRVLQQPRRSWTASVVRGVIAAVLSGVTFYAVSSGLWGRPPAGGRNYLLQYGRWLAAWAPGILAIGWRTKRG
jgi:hypothetical protein